MTAMECEAFVVVAVAWWRGEDRAVLFLSTNGGDDRQRREEQEGVDERPMDPA